MRRILSFNCFNFRFDSSTNVQSYTVLVLMTFLKRIKIGQLDMRDLTSVPSIGYRTMFILNC